MEKGEIFINFRKTFFTNRSVITPDPLGLFSRFASVYYYKLGKYKLASRSERVGARGLAPRALAAALRRLFLRDPRLLARGLVAAPPLPAVRRHLELAVAVRREALHRHQPIQVRVGRPQDLVRGEAVVGRGHGAVAEAARRDGLLGGQAPQAFQLVFLAPAVRGLALAARLALRPAPVVGPAQRAGRGARVRRD